MEIYGADHYGYVIGEEARNFISKTIEKARQYRLLLEEAYLQTRDIDKAAQKVVNSFYYDNPSYFLSREIYLDVHRQMIRHIASVIDGKS